MVRRLEKLFAMCQYLYAECDQNLVYIVLTKYTRTQNTIWTVNVCNLSVSSDLIQLGSDWHSNTRHSD